MSFLWSLISAVFAFAIIGFGIFWLGVGLVALVNWLLIKIFDR